MIKIDYPSYDFRIREENGKETIFDPQRKLWVRLTPEEWVRQNIVQYLLQVKNYPASLIAIEKEILLGELRKRFDILVFKNAVPWMIIECKEMNVALTENVLRQALHYNSHLQSSYLVITNGRETYCFDLAGGKATPAKEFPEFQSQDYL